MNKHPTVCCPVNLAALFPRTVTQCGCYSATATPELWKAQGDCGF